MRILARIVVLILCLLAQACKNPAEVAYAHFQQGKALFEAKKYDDSYKELMLAVQLNSKQADVYYYLALLDEMNKRWQPMFDNLSHAISLNPSHIQAHAKLANLEMLSGLIPQAEKDIEVVLKAEPDNVEAIIIKGNIFLKKKKYKEALEFANKALESDAGNNRAINLKASVLTQQQDFDGALDILDHALKSKPNDIGLHMSKMQVHKDQNNIKAVEEDYIDLIKRLPDNLEFRYALIKIFTESNRFADADAMYKTILNKNPADLNIKKSYIEFITKSNPQYGIVKSREFIKQNPEAIDLYVLLARVYINERQLTEAKQTLDFVIEHKWTKESDLNVFEYKIESKQVLQAKAMLASMAYNAHDQAEANRLIAEILSVDSLHYDALLLRAKIKIDDNQIDEALSILRIIANEYPDKDEQFVLMAKAYLLQKSPELADESFRKAVEINPGNFDAVIPVANKMIEHKDLKRAEELLNKALETKPDQAEALQALEKIRKLKKAINESS
ncbi:MAG: tetratricopeptide repeat protein [Methylomonas sp.]|jgi:predicted Zn-dependent protease